MCSISDKENERLKGKSRLGNRFPNLSGSLLRGEYIWGVSQKIQQF